jgi:hypothetical protein
MEALVEVIAEVVIQVTVELLSEIGLRRIRDAVTKPVNPWISSIIYGLLGSLAGGISLLLFPSHFLKTPTARVLNLILAPVVAGAAMAALGAWRRRKGQSLIRLDTFAYGYLFALAMAGLRFAFCK